MIEILKNLLLASLFRVGSLGISIKHRRQNINFPSKDITHHQVQQLETTFVRKTSCEVVNLSLFCLEQKLLILFSKINL